MSARPLSVDFFARKVDDVAPDLVGCFLFTIMNGMRAGGVIVETEAYDENDPACHCHPLATLTRRKHSAPMRLIGGHACVHRDRRMWCLNITCDTEGFGSAVLIRAIKPTDGSIEIMSARRTKHRSSDKRIKERQNGFERALCSGPSKLCEALGITDAQNEQSVFEQPFELYARSTPANLLNGPRINISRGETTSWRWGLAGTQGFLSKKFS
jgi:DNA-3-methyladenine glycosylase